MRPASPGPWALPAAWLPSLITRLGVLGGSVAPIPARGGWGMPVLRSLSRPHRGWNALSSSEGGIAHRWRWDSRARRTTTHTPRAGNRRDQGRNPFSRRPLALRGIGPCSFLTVRRQVALRAPPPGAPGHAPAARCVPGRDGCALEEAGRTHEPETAA